MASLKEVEKDFKALIEKDALGHAYVLFGPDVPALFNLARCVANFLEVKKWEEPSRVLFDAKLVDGTVEDLGVEVAREFSEFLYRQPVTSSRRTLVVGGAAELTRQAQSALLKIVEEPPSHGLVILIVRDVHSLLPALRSRLQAFFVAGRLGGVGEKSPLEQKAVALVEKFLMSGPDARKQMVKQMVEADKDDDVEKSEEIVDTFVSCLIEELAKKPEENALVLKEALKRQSAMADYSTSKKLQIEAIAAFLR